MATPNRQAAAVANNKMKSNVTQRREKVRAPVLICEAVTRYIAPIIHDCPAAPSKLPGPEVPWRRGSARAAPPRRQEHRPVPPAVGRGRRGVQGSVKARARRIGTRTESRRPGSGRPAWRPGRPAGGQDQDF